MFIKLTRWASGTKLPVWVNTELVTYMQVGGGGTPATDKPLTGLHFVGNEGEKPLYIYETPDEIIGDSSAH